MRLIDVDSLVEWLTKPTGFKTNCEDCPSHDFECVQCVVDEAIKNAPSIDPVKHGRWIYNNQKSRWHENAFDCSVCKEEVYVDSDYGYYTPDHKYCPNCGAKMDAES